MSGQEISVIESLTLVQAIKQSVNPTQVVDECLMPLLVERLPNIFFSRQRGCSRAGMSFLSIIGQVDYVESLTFEFTLRFFREGGRSGGGIVRTVAESRLIGSKFHDELLQMTMVQDEMDCKDDQALGEIADWMVRVVTESYRALLIRFGADRESAAAIVEKRLFETCDLPA